MSEAATARAERIADDMKNDPEWGDDAPWALDLRQRLGEPVEDDDARAVDDAERQAAEAAAAEEVEAGAADKKRKKSRYEWIATEKTADSLADALLRMTVALRFNERAARAEISEDAQRTWLPLDGLRMADLRTVIAQRFGMKIKDGEVPLHFGRETWELARDAVLHRNRVDPAEVWLRGLRWDGEPRYEELLDAVLLVDRDRTPDALAQWASRFLTLGAVTRTFRPGCKLDESPVLIGPQKIGKSTLLRLLVPDEQWFSDGLVLSAPAKERAETLQQRLIVEASEMSGASRADLESLKAFMTRQDDGSIRLAFRPDPYPLPRRCIIVGTANGASLPNDSSGNRRFVAVHLKEHPDGDAAVGRLREYVTEHREQLWAEAVQAFDNGIEARLPADLFAAQEVANEGARRGDMLLEDRVGAFLQTHHDDADGFGISSLAVALGFAKDEQHAAADLGQRDMTRLSSALNLHGYEKRRLRVAGRREYRWFPAAA